MKKPICEFKNQKELNKCLKWWCKKLFLTDWIIKAKIIPQSEFELPDSSGENLMIFEQKTAQIHLLEYKAASENSFTKYCQEKVLVHELLHCKYNYMQDSNGSYEGKFLDAHDHQTLEEMAKTLIMVKYKIPFGWFKK